MPRLRPIDGDPPIASGERIVIGRGDGCDVVLARDTVSSLHAAIEWQGEGWYIKDLGSRNGTAVDGRWISDWQRLNVGSKVDFGPGCRYVVEDVGNPRTGVHEAPSTRRVGEDRAPRCALRLLQVGGGIIELTVGSRRVTWDEHETRWTLLFVLARELLENPTDPWVEDDPLRVAIYGRRAADTQAASTLGKLIHDTRKMLAGAGVVGQVIEKKRGRTRLTLEPTQVTVE